MVRATGRLEAASGSDDDSVMALGLGSLVCSKDSSPVHVQAASGV